MFSWSSARTDGLDMNLQNLKINFLGDSITEGIGASAPDLCYVALMKNLYSLAAARNYGISGTRIAAQQSISADSKWDMDFCGRFNQMDSDADIVVVFGGTNDFGHGDAPLGQPGDHTPATFYGACTYLFSNLKRHYPHALIVALTPMHRRNESDPAGDYNKPHPIAPLKVYVDILREVVTNLGIPLLELFDTDRNPAALRISSDFFPDGVHPNDKGHRCLAHLLGDFLEHIRIP